MWKLETANREGRVRERGEEVERGKEGGMEMGRMCGLLASLFPLPTAFRGSGFCPSVFDLRTSSTNLTSSTLPLLPLIASSCSGRKGPYGQYLSAPSFPAVSQQNEQ